MSESRELPILAYKDAIVDTIRGHPVTVIAAETGAGKSTQVPLMLLRAGLTKTGRVGITQPRRVAAMSVSKYVAELHGTPLGGTIGYQIRGERVVSPETRVKFMTEGILLRELHHDPRLAQYDAVIVDEAHERGINQDLILALLKRLHRERPDMKIIIMSATIDEDWFAMHFKAADDAPAPIVKVPGRLYPVDVQYADETPFGMKNVISAATQRVERAVARRTTGDILIFMPDEKSIKETCKAIDGRVSSCRILPLYGNQSPDEQRAVFVRTEERRIIVATNIAETSLTIDGVTHVIDSGLIKEVQYVNASMSALQVAEHSQAGCEQRRGRAGRTAPGICERLFTKEDFENRPKFTEPEIRRMALDQILLHLRTLEYSLEDVKKFEFMDPPGEDRWDEAHERLVTLGAIDATGVVTPDGIRMERLPLAPMLGRMLLTAATHECVESVATIVAGMTARPVFVRPREKEDEADRIHQQFRDPTSDALTLLNVWRTWDHESGENGSRNAWARDRFLSSRALRDIDRNCDQLLGILEHEGIAITDTVDPQKIRKAVAAGLLTNLCVHVGGFDYRWKDRGVMVHPGSSLFKSNPTLMVCAEIVETSKVFARGCTAVDAAWIDELIPSHLRTVEWHVDTIYGATPRILWCVSWQGTEILREEVTTFSQEALDVIAVAIARETIASPFGRDLHPQSAENRLTLDEICTALEVSRFSLRAPEKTALARLYEKVEPQVTADVMTYRLIRHIDTRIAGASTLADIRTRDLRIAIEDWLTPEQRAEAEIRLAARMEAQRARDDARRAEGEERAAAFAGVRAAIAELRERLAAFPDARYTLRYDLDRIASVTHDNWGDPERYMRELRTVGAELTKLERADTVASDAADTIRATIRSTFPHCPICEGGWREEGNFFRCLTTHDGVRLIPFTDDRALRTNNIPMGSFMTDRDELAAEVALDASQGVTVTMNLAFRRGWQGKKFKKIAYNVRAVILPEALAPKRDQIVQDLAELDAARAELAAFTAKVETLKAEHGANNVRTLTFRTEGGYAVATQNGIRYQAALQAIYPSAGETWICRMERDVSMGGTTAYRVIPELKVEGASAEEDLEIMRALLRESYPGIPEELLR